MVIITIITIIRTLYFINYCTNSIITIMTTIIIIRMTVIHTATVMAVMITAMTATATCPIS